MSMQQVAAQPWQQAEVAFLIRAAAQIVEVRSVAFPERAAPASLSASSSAAASSSSSSSSSWHAHAFTVCAQHANTRDDPACPAGEMHPDGSHSEIHRWLVAI